MAKYTQAEVDALGAKGHAFGPDDDGHYSYPIDDAEDLDNAIHAVGRGSADHDAIRKYIIGRAKDMGLSDKIPDNWNSDGSLKEEDSTSAPEHRAAHAAFTGTHSHEHSAMGDQGADDNHTHEHSHDGDANHDHPHTNAKVPAQAIRGELHHVSESRISTGPKFELREVPDGTGGTNLKFTGFASVTGEAAAYEMEDWLGPWTESISVGAFKKTLDEGADVAFLLNHTGMTLARTKPGTLKLSEETEPNASPVYGVTGLHSEALLDPQNMYVQAMRSAVERGDLDEMSFAFRVMRQEWNADWTRRWINEVSLDKGDVSLVNYGANPSTGGTVTLRQRFSRPKKMDRLAVVKTLEARIGKTLSSDTVGSLQGILDLIDQSDTSVDNALVQLSALMGVTNPDIAQDAELPDRQPNPDPNEGDEDLGYKGPFWLSHSTDQARTDLEAMRYAPRRAS